VFEANSPRGTNGQLSCILIAELCQILKFKPDARIVTTYELHYGEQFLPMDGADVHVRGEKKRCFEYAKMNESPDLVPKIS
jgi:hypothetical protein